MARRALVHLALLGPLLLAGAGGLVHSDADHAGSPTQHASAGSPSQRTPLGAGTPVVKENLYVFIHIPKCAGSSFLNCLTFALPFTGAGQELLGHIYPEGNSYNAKGCGPPSSPSSPPSARQRASTGGPRTSSPGLSELLDSLRGGAKPPGPTHCSVGEIHDCLGSGHLDMKDSLVDPGQISPRYFTILRHPVARVLSEYFWWLSSKSQAWPSELHKEAVRGLTNWVRSPYNVAHNRMVKQLSATSALAPIRRPRQEPSNASAEQTECMTMDMQYYQQYWMGKYNLSWKQGLEARINADTSLLDEAERRLWFAGTQEDLMESANRLLGLVDASPIGNWGPHIEACQSQSQAGSHSSNAKRKVATRIENQRRRAAGLRPLETGQVPEDIVKEIEERNKLDMALYRRHAADAGAGQARNLRQRLEDPEGRGAGWPWTWEEVLQGDID